ncbi:hypothetical protein TTHT_1836 [Thermotomaculum hydrothermale]|uniref:Tetratricopeptide repeat protein n=1 Tax=Thermotomaculum hydrothermale TaxID=981385 RepID=A0A7R6PIM4_9BACT|nr:tetratricopeptide repeat protein [Thermotomaculum hydrothermale]BBB33294.1 hypothetical protein TTHT_1836 [Thermotomaculum hydrothermale]
MRKPFIALIFLLSFCLVFGQTASGLYNKVQADSTKHIEKGKKYLKNNNLKKAEKEFKDAIKAWKHAYAAYAYLGIVYYQKRDFNKSKEYFEKSIFEFQKFKENYLKMKRDYIKNFELRAKELGIVLDKHNLNYGAGDALEYYQYSEQMRALRGRSISYSVNPTVFEAYKNDYVNKYKNLQKEYEKDKNMQYDAFFRFKYGNTLMALKDFRGAIEQYSAAINQDPNLKDAYTNLSVAYFMLGDCNNAKKYYELAKKKKAFVRGNYVNALKKRCGIK